MSIQETYRGRKYDLWDAVCAFTEDRCSEPPRSSWGWNQRRKFATAQYRALMGEWPPRGVPYGVRSGNSKCPVEVEMAIRGRLQRYAQAMERVGS